MLNDFDFFSGRADLRFCCYLQHLQGVGTLCGDPESSMRNHGKWKQMASKKTPKTLSRTVVEKRPAKMSKKCVKYDFRHRFRRPGDTPGEPFSVHLAPRKWDGKTVTLTPGAPGPGTKCLPPPAGVPLFHLYNRYFCVRSHDTNKILLIFKMSGRRSGRMVP